MSRILRSTNPISHTPVKAYPLVEPKEAPYQPMHPNLQGAFDASGAKLTSKAFPRMKYRFENGDILFIAEHYNNDRHKPGPILNLSSGNPTITCFYRVSKEGVKMLQVHVNYGYERGGSLDGLPGNFYLMPVDDESQASVVNWSHVPPYKRNDKRKIKDVNTGVMYRMSLEPLQFEGELKEIPFGQEYADALAGRDVYKEYMGQRDKKCAEQRAASAV